MFKAVQIGMRIGTGRIVWGNGPFPSGTHNDIKIYRLNLKSRLDIGEKIVADAGSLDGACSHPILNEGSTDFRRVRAKQEALNKRIKQFGYLNQPYRHDIRKHSSCFFAVLNTTELLLRSNQPIFTYD